MGTDVSKPKAGIKSFRDLEAWKACRKVRQAIFALTHKLPAAEKYRLTDQMIRASRSATANLAEGYGRYHYQETIQFCRQSRGSLYELLDHLSVARECGYITEKAYAGHEAQVVDAIRLLNGFVRYLRGRRKTADA